MRRLNDLKLTKKTQEKVESWLNEWVAHLKVLADGNEGTVYRNNFETMDIFFFTNCNNILTDNVAVRERKRDVFLQLFLKYLMGEDVNVTSHCTHCGYDSVITDSYGYGSFKYCSICGMITPCIHPEYYNISMDLILEKIKGMKKI